MISPCVGPCNAGYWREQRDHAAAMIAHELAVASWLDALAEWEETPAGPRPREPHPPAPPRLIAWEGDPVWCLRCAHRVYQDLLRIGDLAVNLVLGWDGHRSAAASEGGRSANAPSPSPAVDTADQLYGDLAVIEAAHRTRSGYAPRPDRGRGTTGLQMMTGWFAAEHNRLITGPDAEEYGTMLLRWRRLLEQLTGLHRDTQHRRAPCPGCDERALVLQDDGWTRCRRCFRAMQEVEYTAIALRDEQELACRRRKPTGGPVSPRASPAAEHTDPSESVDLASGTA